MVNYTLSQLRDTPVAFLDLDQIFCNTEILLKQKAGYSLGDIASTPADDVDEALLGRIMLKSDAAISGSGGQIHALVASKSVMGDNPLITAELLDATLTYLSTHYPYVIVDLPTHVLDPYHQAVAERADELLIVTTPDIPSLHRTRQYLDLAHKYLDMNKVKMVLNRHTMKAAYRMSNAEVEQEFRYPVFARIPNDWDLHVEATSLGSPLSALHPKCDVAKAIRKLAEQLNGEATSHESGSSSSGKGLFARLLKPTS